MGTFTTSRARRPSGLGALAAIACALGLALVPASAGASDAYPCEGQVMRSWSPVPVQRCPLTSPLTPNGWVPVYRTPVAVAAGAAPPPAGWLHALANQYFVCDHRFAGADYKHPGGWTNDVWAFTRSDEGVWGWVPEVFFRGGGNHEADGGLRPCPASPAPATPPPPGTTPLPPPAPKPITAPVTSYFLAGRSGTRVTTLSVAGVPAGGAVAVRCKGHGCPFAHRSVAVRHGRADAQRLFKRHALREGARIEVRITAPGRIGRVVRFTIHRGRHVPRPRYLCLAPGSSSPHRC